LKAIELYIADLKSSVHDKRKRAINALISLKEKEAVRPLLNIANDRNVEIRYMLAKAFGSFDEKALIDALIKYLSDESPKVRYRAAMSLANHKNDKAIEPLVKALADNDENVRYWVAKALAKHSQQIVIPKLQVCLSSQEWVIRKNASMALADIGKPSLEFLFHTIKNAGDDAKFWAVRALGKIADTSAVPILLTLLTDPNQDVQIATIEALGNISDARAIGPLTVLLESHENHIKQPLIKALCKIGDKCVPQLIKTLGSVNWNARHLASAILGEIGGRSIELLLSELKTENDDQLYWTIEALGELGDKVVTVDLIKFLNHPKNEIKIASLRALGKIVDDRSLEALITLLNENDENIINPLINAISAFGGAAVSHLVKYLGAPKWHIRQNAARCLTQIGPDITAKRMLDLLDCKNRDVCHWASEVIISFKNFLEDDLIKFLDFGSYDQRYYSSRILGRIKSLKSVSSLITCLQDEYWAVRKNAAFSLGEIGTRDAAPALVKALNDEDEDLRAEVCRALAKLKIKQAGKYLIPFIDDEFSNVRIAAINAVSALDYKEAIPSIAARINDDNVQVRIAAIEGAGRLKADGCVNLLLKQMDIAELRSYIIKAIGEIGSITSVKYLISLLKGDNRDERAITALALGNFEQRECIKALTEAISDEYYLVRKNAALSLTNINEKQNSSANVKNKEKGYVSEIDSLYSLGMTFMNGKKYSEAIVAFQRLIALDKSHYNALLKLGIAYENKDMMNEAIESFTKCIRNEPNRADAYIYLGVALGSRRKYEEAIGNLKKAEECTNDPKFLDIIKKLTKKIKIAMYENYSTP